MEIEISIGSSGNPLEDALLQILITGVGVAFGSFLSWAIPEAYLATKELIEGENA